MSDQTGHPPRRPLAQPFSHAGDAADEPLAERLLPAERLGSPFSAPTASEAEPGQALLQSSRRRLGPGGLAAQAPA
ncbi:hypothetical protein [Kitasatospora sp. MY 5-36]|uniref:hypothetical protein n=1 Tax=Kitasatospora sp. MY 5-36 TaxID=1678027 RepID=UPI000670CB6E|nr:hypothetical protein [Kitasatospora sp. MY 5-36]